MTAASSIPPRKPLVIDGGPRTLPDVAPEWPPHDPAVRAALEQAWADGSWGRYHGPHSERLTELLTEKLQVPHALLCCSGTFAVELALRALKVGPGDEVILAGYDFPGNFRAIEAVGARPVLVDLGPDTWAIDPAAVERAIGPEVRAVIVSHLHGTLADMPRLRALADDRGISIVEDVCQAPGAEIAGRPAGSWGDVGVLSFGGSKLLTAGRGGAIVSRSDDVIQRAKVFCDRGNNAFPLSELQAALLVPQVERLDERNRQRRWAVEQLLAALGEVKGLRPPINQIATCQKAFYKLGWFYSPAEQKHCSIERFVAAAQAEGIPIDRGFRGFVLRSTRRCRTSGALSNSGIAANQTLLLHHPILLEPPESIAAIGAALANVCQWLTE